MSYKLITGEFRIKGFSPDGDSLRFKPDTQAGIRMLNAMGAEAKGTSGTYQLRFEGIDALETHYKNKHQYWPLASAAAKRLLDVMGFEDVEYGKREVVGVRKDDMPGYILTRRIDNHQYRRAVAFVVPGRSSRPTTESLFIDENLVSKTVNATLAREGLAFPAFYTSLPWDLRLYFTDLVAGARKKHLGIWKRDVTNKFTAVSLSKLDELTLWPKLYRRLLAYFGTGARGLAGFEKWLRAGGPKCDDEIIILSRGERANLHNVLDIDATRIRMNRPPEDINVVEDIVRDDASEPTRPKRSASADHMKAAAEAKKRLAHKAAKL